MLLPQLSVFTFKIRNWTGAGIGIYILARLRYFSFVISLNTGFPAHSFLTVLLLGKTVYTSSWLRVQGMFAMKVFFTELGFWMNSGPCPSDRVLPWQSNHVNPVICIFFFTQNFSWVKVSVSRVRMDRMYVSDTQGQRNGATEQLMYEAWVIVVNNNISNTLKVAKRVDPETFSP